MSQAMHYPDRLKRLQEEKNRQGLSCQQIVDIVLAEGGITSLGTVKKIFSQGAHEKKFKDISLAPVEKALGIIQNMPPASLPPATEEFYHGIIRELNDRLKDCELRLKTKNAAIGFLIAFQFAWLFIDAATPGSGWFGSDAGYIWIIKLAVLVVFCAFYALARSKHKQD